ncbi:unnamed protein product [Sphagnum jensenii]|uniref:Uncharacterized protein n=1 Tax=Sphagnum jensenii TaxID=128206 RepID=A0ABP1AJR0_9BRYO
MANSFMQEEVVLGELTEWIYHKTGVIIAPDELCHIAEEMSVALKASKEKEKALQAKSMSYELDDMKNELLRALTQIGLAEEDVEKLAEECSELKLENKALHLEIENLKGNGRVSCWLQSVSSDMVAAERAVSCPGNEMRATEGRTNFYWRRQKRIAGFFQVLQTNMSPDGRGTIHPNLTPQWPAAEANSCGLQDTDTTERMTSLSHNSKSGQTSSGCCAQQAILEQASMKNGGLVNAEGMPSEAKRVNLSPSIHTPSFHRHPIVIGTRCSISDSSSFTYADPQIRQIWHRT